jgi:hypothetical protein
MERLVQDPRVDARIQQRIQQCAQERVVEFHNRLLRNVEKLTCDVPQTDAAIERLMTSYEEGGSRELRTLTKVLWLELQQVVKAVQNAK